MTTTTQAPAVPFNHFSQGPPSAVFGYSTTSTTLPQSHQQSPLQQDSSDCGSSSGVGGSGMTNKHESDSSSIESDSPDSGAGPPQGPHIINQNGLIIHPPNYPGPHQPHFQQQRYPHPPPRQWVSGPPPQALRIQGNPPIQLLTMAMAGGAKGYETCQPPPPPPPGSGAGIISAGPTMSQGPVTPGISTTSPTSNGAATSGTPSNGPPTGPQIPPTHDVWVHVHSGEFVRLCLSNNNTDMKLIRGPASIRVTSLHNRIPTIIPSPIPPGHIIQQIPDEQGNLKHVIISPQQSAPPSAAGSRPGLPQRSGATTPLKGIPNAIPSTSNGASPKSISPPVSGQYSQPGIPPELLNDPNYLAIRQQQQQQQWNGAKRSSTPGFIQLPPGMDPATYAALYPGYPPLGVVHPTLGHAYNGLLPTHAQAGDDTEFDEFEDDEKERERLREALNSILPPMVQKIFPKEVEVTWQNIDTSEAAAAGGPFPQIDTSEFVYEVFVYEGRTGGSVFTSYRCEPQPSGNVLKIEKLKPNTLYSVTIRATLPERDVIGNYSQPTPFKTLSIFHDVQPHPPKIGTRGPTWVNVMWRTALNSIRMQVKDVIVQIARGKGEFTTAWEGTGDQARITDLEPATNYRFRIIFRNDSGDTEPSQPTYGQTAPLNQMQNNQQQQQQHHTGPSSSHEVKLSPPQIIGCYNRTIKLSWTPAYGFHKYTLETCESRTGDFHPVDHQCYINNTNQASVGHLQSNREYYFRLSAVTDNGQTLRSEVISAKTRKEQYENSAYQGQAGASSAPNTSSYYESNNRERTPPAPSHLQGYDNGKHVELTWRYNGREFDGLIFNLEGATASAENNSIPETSWTNFFKGRQTTATVADPAINLFRVQSYNTRKHQGSAWTEPYFVKRVVPKPKRSIPEPPPAPVIINPPTCTAPKFSEITWCSVQAQWKLAEEIPETSTGTKTSLIYELQRVDAEAVIIYSGDHAQYKMENLKPNEHVQVRARAVVVDNSGKRNEGEWSPIGSACTPCTAPSPPVNLRLMGEGLTPTLMWDAPLQLNGADIKTYVLTGTKSPLTGESEGKPKKLGETSKTEFSFGKLTPATHYTVKIVAINKGGESEPSETLEFDSPSTEPECPQELHIEAISSTELQFSWSPGADNGSPITGYRLIVHEMASESRSATKHLVAQHQISEDVTNFVASKLKPATLYELEIVAQNSVGTSESVSMRCETFASPPDPPELSLVQAQSNVLKLKWQPVASSSTAEPSYFYLEKENDSGTFSPVFEGEARMTKIKGLREQTVHRFRIRSAHAKGIVSLMGPWSQTYEFSTSRLPPPAVKGPLVVSEVSQAVFQIEWTPVKVVAASTGTGEEDQFVYRLQVTPKMERRTAVEPWKTIYEGTCPGYTLAVSSQSTSSKMVRVFVVQKFGSEELCSAPSAIAQFASIRTPTESPRKRVKPASGNSTPSQPSEDDAPTRGSLTSLHRNRMSLYRRSRKWIGYVRKFISERNGSFVVLVCLILIAFFVYLLL